MQNVFQQSKVFGDFQFSGTPLWSVTALSSKHILSSFEFGFPRNLIVCVTLILCMLTYIWWCCCFYYLSLDVLFQVRNSHKGLLCSLIGYNAVKRIIINTNLIVFILLWWTAPSVVAVMLSLTRNWSTVIITDKRVFQRFIYSKTIES